MYTWLVLVALLIPLSLKALAGSPGHSKRGERGVMASERTTGVTIGHAESADTAQLVKIVNDAYEVEVGDSGVAFKKDGVMRLRSEAAIEEFARSVSSERCLVVRDGQEILACLVYEVNKEDSSVFFGPFAAKYKGKGHGMLLYKEFERKAKEDLEVKQISLYVVNHRTELIQLYTKLGFVEQETTAVYPSPELCSRPSYFVIMNKQI